MATRAPTRPPKMAAMAEATVGIAPPMPMLWSTANKLPAAMLPIVDWIMAAKLPGSFKGLNATSSWRG